MNTCSECQGTFLSFFFLGHSNLKLSLVQSFANKLLFLCVMVWVPVSSQNSVLKCHPQPTASEAGLSYGEAVGLGLSGVELATLTNAWRVPVCPSTVLSL